MSKTIHVLSEQTINQIAAGEVIENPASVIKELIENSVDAQATRIIIEIYGGGFQTICISDNGQGMSREDLLVCLKRHATSKIRCAHDLTSIFSMGFRGEALASIAAISKITVSSCQKEEAYELFAEKGSVQSCKAASRHIGTTVEVRSLFYNVPARKKFQKSPRASQNEIMKILTQLALAHSQLELRCFADGKEIFSSFMKRSKEKETMREEVIEKVLGPKFLNGAFKVDVQQERSTLLGFIGAPNQTRKNRMGQHLFVNGRPVTAPEITRAIYDGYGTRLHSHEHPTFVLHVTLPTEWIDVNVHPQKKEIRLYEIHQIKNMIRKGMIKAFQETKVSLPTMPVFKEALPSLNWNEQVTPMMKSQEKEEITFASQLPILELPFIGLYAHYLILDASRFQIPLSGPTGMVLVDLQAAESQIIFSSILDRFQQDKEVQTLLFPITFECSTYEKEQIDFYLETLQKLGIFIRPFGEKTFVIDALNPHLEEDKIEKLVYELIHVLDQFGDHEHLEKEEKKKLALTTLRFARSQKKEYTLDQARAIVKELLTLSSPYQSPRGKPTCVYLSKDEIANYFR